MDMKVQTATGEAYGSYFPLVSLSIIFSVLLDLGINNYNNRKIAAHPARFKNYFSSITSWTNLTNCFETDLESNSNKWSFNDLSS